LQVNPEVLEASSNIAVVGWNLGLKDFPDLDFQLLDVKLATSVDLRRLAVSDLRGGSVFLVLMLTVFLHLNFLRWGPICDKFITHRFEKDFLLLHKNTCGLLFDRDLGHSRSHGWVECQNISYQHVHVLLPPMHQLK
jgi:hypothetical protein